MVIEINETTQFIFQVNDLPLEGLTELSVRFDLMGPGEVWIDDVELFDLTFSKNEVRELSKLITLAHITLQNGRLGDCLRLLDGYWPQFLEDNVPFQDGGEVARRDDPDQPPAEEPPPKTGVLDQMKGLLPKRLRF